MCLHGWSMDSSRDSLFYAQDKPYYISSSVLRCFRTTTSSLLLCPSYTLPICAHDVMYLHHVYPQEQPKYLTSLSQHVSCPLKTYTHLNHLARPQCTHTYRFRRCECVVRVSALRCDVLLRWRCILTNDVWNPLIKCDWLAYEHMASSLSSRSFSLSTLLHIFLCRYGGEEILSRCATGKKGRRGGERRLRYIVFNLSLSLWFWQVACVM